MSDLLYVVASFVDVLLTALYFAIFISVILSWLPIDGDSRFVRFIDMITDPVLVPIHSLLSRIPLFANFPLDFSPFIAMILIFAVQALLGTLH